MITALPHGFYDYPFLYTYGDMIFLYGKLYKIISSQFLEDSDNNLFQFNRNLGQKLITPVPIQLLEIFDKKEPYLQIGSVICLKPTHTQRYGIVEKIDYTNLRVSSHFEFKKPLPLSQHTNLTPKRWELIKNIEIVKEI